MRGRSCPGTIPCRRCDHCGAWSDGCGPGRSVTWWASAPTSRKRWHGTRVYAGLADLRSVGESAWPGGADRAGAPDAVALCVVHAVAVHELAGGVVGDELG